MDLEAARKTLSKRSAFSTKKIAFIGVAGLLLVSGIAWRATHYFHEAPAEAEPAAAVAPAPEAAAPPPTETTESVVEKSPVTPAAPVTQEAEPASSDPVQHAGETAGQPDAEEAEAIGQAELAPEAAGQAEQADLPGSGMILVARKPVEVLASPSPTAPAMFGFPAGRPFRVIGREGSFVQIQDLRSSASGWIDATALAEPPRAAPSAVAPSQSKPSAARKPATTAADPKPKGAPKAPKKGAPAVADSDPAAKPDPAQARRPPALFGRDGFFGGIFSN